MSRIALAALACALAAQPVMAGAVLICTPFGCRSSPYFPPPIVPPSPPVIWQNASPGHLPPPYPPLGPDFPPPPVYPLAPPLKLRPGTMAPPYPPLGPSYQEPPVAQREPMPAPPPPARAMTRDQEREWIISHGEAFCAKYPDDKVCHPAKNPAP